MGTTLKSINNGNDCSAVPLLFTDSMLKYGKSIIYSRLEGIVILRLSKTALTPNSSHFLEKSIEYIKNKFTEEFKLFLKTVTVIILYKKILFSCIKLFVYKH